MPKYYHPDVLDNGLQELIDNANQVHVIDGYTQGDAYATVVAASVANATAIPGDYTLGNQGTLGRQVTTPAKSPNASATSSGDLHIAFLDSVGSRVLAVTDETSDQVITSGNQVNIPAVNLKMNQPV